MDDPFGCLRGVELVEHDLYKLTSEMAEKEFNALPRSNHCPSCGVHLVNVMNEFCRECPECHRVFEYDVDDQFQEVSPGRSAAPSAHLKNSLRKWKIYEIFSFNQISFLGNVIAQLWFHLLWSRRRYLDQHWVLVSETCKQFVGKTTHGF